MRTALVTGSSGLIGSEAVAFLDERGWRVHGVDNNMRRDFFGRGRRHDAGTSSACSSRRPGASSTTTSTSATATGSHRLVAELAARADRPLRRAAVARPRRAAAVRRLRRQRRRDAQPARGRAPPRARVAVRLPVDEQGLRRRAERARRSSSSRRAGTTPTPRYANGIDETMRIDATMHSLFGASKVGGRRAGAGVRPLLRDADGLLPRRLPHRPEPLRRRAARLPRLPRARRQARDPYRIYGYKGKQVRDNIHSYDVCTAIAGLRREPARGRRLQPRRRPREQRLDARGDRALRGAVRPHARVRVRRRAEARRPHLLHQRPRAPPRRLTRVGADPSRSTRSARSSRARAAPTPSREGRARRRRRRAEPDGRRRDADDLDDRPLSARPSATTSSSSRSSAPSTSTPPARRSSSASSGSRSSARP